MAKSALPVVVFTVPPDQQCTMCNRDGLCTTCRLEPDPNEAVVLHAIAEAQNGQEAVETTGPFMALSEAENCCQVSKAIYESKSSLWKESNKRETDPHPGHNQEEGKESTKIILEAYDRLLDHFRRTQRCTPGFDTQLEQFLVVKGLIQGSADTIGQLGKMTTALEGQLHMAQEMVALLTKDQGVKRIRTEPESESQATLGR